MLRSLYILISFGFCIAFGTLFVLSLPPVRADNVQRRFYSLLDDEVMLDHYGYNGNGLSDHDYYFIGDLGCRGAAPACTDSRQGLLRHPCATETLYSSAVPVGQVPGIVGTSSRRNADAVWNRALGSTTADPSAECTYWGYQVGRTPTTLGFVCVSSETGLLVMEDEVL